MDVAHDGAAVRRERAEAVAARRLQQFRRREGRISRLHARGRAKDLRGAHYAAFPACYTLQTNI